MSNRRQAPWIETNFLDTDTKKLGWMIESLEIDPHDSDRWLYGTGVTIYGGHDLTNWDSNKTVTIQSLASGIEEMAVSSLASAPGGPELLMATLDNNGFTYESAADLGTAPQTAWTDPWWASAVSVDFAGNDASKVARVGKETGSPQLALSADGGATWAVVNASGTTAADGTVAYSADGDVVLWSTLSEGVLASRGQGKLENVTLPAGSVIASDKKNGTVFYAGSEATFYVSADGAATFTESSSALGEATDIRHIAAHPAAAGELWVSTDAGVFHSADFGQTFTQLSSGPSDAHAVSAGKGDGASWNLYAFGAGPEGKKLYGSADGGETWSDIQGGHSFGAVDGAALVGSANEAGVVYVGTNGRGTMYSSCPIAGNSSAAAAPSARRLLRRGRASRLGRANL